jgi:signal transduction histidine kinase/ActR/RegA family two-component response regulator
VKGEELLVEAFDEMPLNASIVEGPEFVVVAVNRCNRESPIPALGKRLADFYPGNTPLRQALERVAATGFAETLPELPTYFPDGSYAGRYFTRSFLPLRDAPDGAKRIMVCVQEVTELVQARARSAAEQERLRALTAALDEVPIYVTILEGPEFEAIAANRKARETPYGSPVGKRLDDLYPGASPIRTILERVYATGLAETAHELPTYFPDGKYKDQYFTRAFIPIETGPGGVKRILACVYEVTEAVQARARVQEMRAEHERLFALLEEAPSLIGVLEGPELRLVMMNRRMRELFAGRVPYPLGTSMADLVSPDNRTLLAACRVYETGVPETVDVVVRDVKGFIGRSFSTTIAPIHNPDGTISRVATSSLETTEQLRIREALEAQTRDLEAARRVAVEAGQAKDQFLAMLGHELRNPLAPMSVAVQVMRLEGVTSPALDILERQVNHLTRLVDDLLDVSRITRGVVTLKRTEVELPTIVNRALEMSSPLLEERNHRVVTDMVHRGLGLWGDPDRLAQVVANLITNAAKYSEPGTRIRITAERAGDRVRLSVADEGVGIAPDMVSKVFEAFVQQPQTLDRAHGGLGLGLAIVKSLVEAHGGSVSVHSAGIGCGSTFVVELPAIEIRSLSDTPLPFVRAESPTTSPLRILVVDDNRDAVDVLRIALAAHGHAVACAYDGPSALEVAATYDPQLALVDIGLPVMDGYRLAELLRASHDIPIVAITGYGQQADLQRSAGAGFAAHLVKPVNIGELTTLIEQLPRRSRGGLDRPSAT